MKQYYLIGSPIRHSLSPAMMNASFENAGLNARYSLMETTAETIGETVELLKKQGASGWNVTMPCKQAMSLLCDSLSTAAILSGAVNTVKNEGGRLLGHTTDGAGFMSAVSEAGFPLPGEKMTLLGSGGAASSILIQAALDGVSEISVFCNRPSSVRRMEEMREKLADHSSARINVCTYGQTEHLRKEIRESRALVNAASIGMEDGRGGENGCLIPDASFFHPGLFVYDIIYHPLKTKLVRMAEEAGLPAEGGLSMLIGQGAVSWNIWTGLLMDTSLVRTVIGPLLQ